jgi:hypothetical protein
VNLKKEDTLKEKEEDPVNNWLSIDASYRTSNGWENCVSSVFFILWIYIKCRGLCDDIISSRLEWIIMRLLSL